MPSAPSAAPLRSAVSPLPASDAYTRWPSRARSSATARPLLPSPITATSPAGRPRKIPSFIAPPRSAELQRAERNDRAQDPEDPESDHHLRLRPALHLEVVVQRRSQEHAVLLRVLQAVTPSPVLEHGALQDHRDHLRDVDPADDDEQELALEQDRDGADRAAEA